MKDTTAPKCWFCGRVMDEYLGGGGKRYYFCPNPKCGFSSPYSSTKEEALALVQMGMPPKVYEAVKKCVAGCDHGGTPLMDELRGILPAPLTIPKWKVGDKGFITVNESILKIEIVEVHSDEGCRVRASLMSGGKDFYSYSIFKTFDEAVEAVMKEVE